MGDRRRRALRGGAAAPAGRGVLDHPGDRGRRHAGQLLLGPSVSLASSKLWVQLGAGFGIGESSGSTFVRSVLGSICETSRSNAPPGGGGGLQLGALAPAFAGGARVPQQVHVLPPRVRAGERNDWPAVLDRMNAEKKTHLDPDERAQILTFLQGSGTTR